MPATTPPQPELFSVLVNDAKLEAITFLRLLIADPARLNGQPLSLIQHRRLAASAVLRLCVPRDSDFEYDPYTPEPAPAPERDSAIQPEPDAEHPEVEPESKPETEPDVEPQPAITTDPDPQRADPINSGCTEAQDTTADIPPRDLTAHAPRHHTDTPTPASLPIRTALRDRPNEPARRAVPDSLHWQERAALQCGLPVALDRHAPSERPAPPSVRSKRQTRRLIGTELSIHHDTRTAVSSAANPTPARFWQYPKAAAGCRGPSAAASHAPAVPPA